MSFAQLMKKPSALLPIVMSLAALLLLVGHVALVGIARQADEGAAARIFQLIMAAQLPVIAYFAVRWFPKAPRSGLLVLALHAVVALVPVATVLVLEAGLY